MLYFPKFKQFSFSCIGIMGIVLLNFVVRLLFASTPLTWDEFNYFIGAMNIAGNNLNPFTFFWGYKGPVVFMPVAVSMYFFGRSPVWAHLYVYCCSSIALYMWYELLKSKFNIRIAFSGVMILALFPLFLTQSFIYTDTIPMTALVITLLFALHTENSRLLTLTSIIMVLTKETTLLLLLTVYIMKHPKRLSSMLSIGIPLGIFILWMIGNKMTFGWFLWPYNVSLVSINMLSTDTAYSIIFNLFVNHGVWVVALPAVIGYSIIYLKNKNTTEFTFLWLLFLIPGSFYFLFPFLHRYLLHLYPILFLITIKIVSGIPSKRIATGIFISIALLFIFLNIKYYFSPAFAEDDDLSFFKRVEMNKKIISTLENKYTDSQIITNWPISEALKNPAFGYVQKKHEVIGISCEQQIHITSDMFIPSKQIVILATTLNSEFHWPKNLPVIDTLKEGNEYAWIGIINPVEKFDQIHDLNYCQN